MKHFKKKILLSFFLGNTHPVYFFYFFLFFPIFVKPPPLFLNISNPLIKDQAPLSAKSFLSPPLSKSKLFKQHFLLIQLKSETKITDFKYFNILSLR